MKRIILLLVIILVLAGGWYFVSPLFITKEVNEEFPLADITDEEGKELSNSVSNLDIDLPPIEELKTMNKEELDKLEMQIIEESNKLPDNVMNEEIQGEEKTGPTLLFAGDFVGNDSFHQGSGKANIYELEGGSKIVRLENFMVTNGPDLRVILTKNQNPSTRGDVQEGYIELGKLKGNVGNQNYNIPSGTDVSQYKGVVIYCKPFHVVFSKASLN